MLRRLRAQLSYANVTATLALFLALGGGAYAAIDLVGRNDIKSKHIAPNQAKGTDVRESSLETVPSARSANPIAFARINSDGNVFEDTSKQVRDGNVSTGDGIYCFHDLGFTPRGVQVQLDWLTAGSDLAAQAALGDSASAACPEADQAFVVVQDPTTLVSEDGGFFIVFYR